MGFLVVALSSTASFLCKEFPEANYGCELLTCFCSSANHLFVISIQYFFLDCFRSIFCITDFREAFSRDRVVTNNASVQSLVDLEAFVLRVAHVDYVDRDVIRFEEPVLLYGLHFLVHLVDEGEEYGQSYPVFGSAAWNNTTLFDCVLVLGVPEMVEKWSRPFFEKFLDKQFRTGFLSCMSLYHPNA